MAEPVVEMMDYLLRFARSQCDRLRRAAESVPSPLIIADLLPVPSGEREGAELLREHGLHPYNLAGTAGDSPWKLEDGLLRFAAGERGFSVDLLPERIEDKPAGVDLSIPEGVDALQVAGRWFFNGFQHPASAAARSAWKDMLKSGRRLLAWGFSMIPHPGAAGGAAMIFFGDKEPETIDELSCSSVTTGPVLFFTAGDKRPGEIFPAVDRLRGRWLELRFVASDVLGLEYIAIHVDNLEMRRLEGRGRREFDAVLQLEVPDGANSVWMTCKSVDGRLCVVNPVWIV